MAARASIEYVGQKSRSFYWPLRLFPEDQAEAIATLYRFCRVADDWADEGEAAPAREYLCGVMDQLRSERTDNIDVRNALWLINEWSVPKIALLHLLQALHDDIGSCQLQSDRELLRFCYGVAGVIGLMLCPLLRVRSEAAKAFAIDLGIAMQLSNIARDLMEDAARERIYMPTLWRGGITDPKLILERSPQAMEVADQAIAQTLDLAEKYYASARNGYYWIPFRSRFPIEVAAAFYREVGRTAGKHKPAKSDVCQKPSRRRLGMVLLQLIATPVPKNLPHNNALHSELDGLPGIQT